jgi:type II secretory ATPase GspE/PulE/Tfp pilus assembly ATPase PilB-like protein
MPPQTTFNRLLERHMTLAERDSHRQNTSATSLINALLREAHAARASDLHLCPADDALIVRFRVDGSLHDAHMLPLHVHAEMVTRIKILAGLRTDEHQAPQDGHFRFELAYYSPLFSAIDSPSTTIDVRVSIIPTYHGENAVLRILASHHSLATLASLGFNPHHQAILERALKTPHGMILSTGSTGSGKTSTLYALLQLLNTRTRSIITIEDPVEYAINGITQNYSAQTNGTKLC